MPKKLGSVARDILVKAPLPKATKTYTVISHQYAIDTIEATLAKHGFEVDYEEFKCTTGAQVAQGVFIITHESDPELNMIYSFSNSYDKSLKFRAAIGACVADNGAYMISQMDNWNRKHTGTADDETEELIEHHISRADRYFTQLIQDKEAMKEVEISTDEYGAMLGQLFIKGFLSIDQFSLAIKEYSEPSFNYSSGPDNLWTCYNHILHALRQSHPTKWLQNQTAIHLYFITKYNLVQFDPEEEEEDEAADENQSDVSLDVQDNADVEGEEDKQDHLNLQEKVEIFQKEEAQKQVGGGEVAAEEEEEFTLPGFAKKVSAEEIIAEHGGDLPEEVQEKLIQAEAEKEEVVNDLPGIEGGHQNVHEERTFDNTTIDGEEGREESEAPVEVVKEEAPAADYPKEWDENAVAEEPLYIEAEEGVAEGDLVTHDGASYKVNGFTEIDDVFYMELLPTEAAVTEEVVQDAPVAEESAPVEEAPLPVAPPAETEPEEVPEELPEPDPIEEEEEEIIEEAEEEEDDNLPIEEESVEETTSDVVEAPAVDDKVKAAIAVEIEEIYGYEPEFTFDESDGQYNVKLESGESLVLSVTYIAGLL